MLTCFCVRSQCDAQWCVDMLPQIPLAQPSYLMIVPHKETCHSVPCHLLVSWVCAMPFLPVKRGKKENGKRACALRSVNSLFSLLLFVIVGFSLALSSSTEDAEITWSCLLPFLSLPSSLSSFHINLSRRCLSLAIANCAAAY